MTILGFSKKGVFKVDDILKQFLLNLCQIGHEVQKKFPDEVKQIEVPGKKGSDPVSPNYQAR